MKNMVFLCFMATCLWAAGNIAQVGAFKLIHDGDSTNEGLGSGMVAINKNTIAVTSASSQPGLGGYLHIISISSGGTLDCKESVDLSTFTNSYAATLPYFGYAITKADSANIFVSLPGVGEIAHFNISTVGGGGANKDCLKATSPDGNSLRLLDKSKAAILPGASSFLGASLNFVKFNNQNYLIAGDTWDQSSGNADPSTSKVGAFYILKLGVDYSLQSAKKISALHGLATKTALDTLNSNDEFATAIAPGVITDTTFSLFVSAGGFDSNNGEVFHMVLDTNLEAQSVSHLNAFNSTAKGNGLGSSLHYVNDLNGDAVKDLLVGATEVAGVSGAMWVFYLNEDNTIQSVAPFQNDSNGMPATGFAGSGSLAAALSPHSRFGESVAILDYNNDDTPELIVGGSGSYSNKGGVFALEMQTPLSITTIPHVYMKSSSVDTLFLSEYVQGSGLVFDNIQKVIESGTGSLSTNDNASLTSNRFCVLAAGAGDGRFKVSFNVKNSVNTTPEEVSFYVYVSDKNSGPISSKDFGFVRINENDTFVVVADLDDHFVDGYADKGAQGLLTYTFQKDSLLRYELDPTTNVLKIASEPHKFGRSFLIISVKNSRGVATLDTLTVIIDNVRSAPRVVLDSTHFVVVEKSSFSLTLPTLDDDGDSIAYVFSESMPSWLSFQKDFSLLTGNAPELKNENKDAVFDITAKDEVKGASDPQPIIIYIDRVETAVSLDFLQPQWKVANGVLMIKLVGQHTLRSFNSNGRVLSKTDFQDFLEIPTRSNVFYELNGQWLGKSLLLK